MLKALLILSFIFINTPARANTCVERYKDLIPELKEIKFKEMGKDAEGTAIAKAITSDGEHTLSRKRDNSATLSVGYKSPRQVVVYFDNANCKVQSVSYLTSRKSGTYSNVSQTAYVDSSFCEFIQHNSNHLSVMPKDFLAYQCMVILCGHYSSTSGACRCDDNKPVPTGGACCMGGKPKENPYLKLKEEYVKLKGHQPSMENLSSEFVRDSRAQCRKWKSMLASPDIQSVKKVDR